MIDACVRGHARGELASKPLRLKARDPLVGVWNGYIPIYTGCISRFGSSLRSPSTRSTVNLRAQSRYVAASRFSPCHFSRYSITDLYLYSSLPLSLSLLPDFIAFPLLSRFLPISSEMKTLSVQRFFLSFRFLISSSRLSLRRKKIHVLERSMEIVIRLLERWFDTSWKEICLEKRTRERSVRTKRRRGRGVGDERGMRPVPFRENPVRHVMYHGRQTGRLMRPSRLQRIIYEAAASDSLGRSLRSTSLLKYCEKLARGFNKKTAKSQSLDDPLENGGREKRRRIGSRTFTFLDLERDGKEWRDREGIGKWVGRRYLRVVCRNAIRSDFDTFRYPIPANISAIDTKPRSCCNLSRH